MKEEIAKRVKEAETLATSLLTTSEAGFTRADGAIDLDKAKELSAEGSRLLESLVNDLKATDAELVTATARVTELEPKVAAADSYIAQATNESRRFLNIMAKAKKDEAKLTDFNKRVDEKSITLEEVLKVGNEARQEYYDMFPPAVVSRAFDPDACPHCGSDRVLDEAGAKSLDCKNCGARFETQEVKKEVKKEEKQVSVASMLPEAAFSTKK
jgi:hypothetical protein